MINDHDQRDRHYQTAAAQFGSALARLARVYEPDPDQRRDLLQDIHLELWRSFSGFNGQCSLRTWVYRVAHNVGISKRLRKRKMHLVSLEETSELPAAETEESSVDDIQILERLHTLIRQLAPPDDQVMVLYLEDLDAASIAEITGLSARAIAMRVHRIKSILARQFRASDIV